MGDKVRTLRISEEASKLLDDNNKRHGDISYHASNAIVAYFNKEPVKKAEVVVSKKEMATVKPSFSDEHMRFSVWAFECIQKTMSGAKKPNFDSWAKDVRLMIERDNRSIDDMANVWQWARNDQFWQSNILSIKKFRDKFDTLKAQSMRPSNISGVQYKTAQEKRAERNGDIYDYEKATTF